MAKMTRKAATVHARYLRAFAKGYLAEGLETWKDEEDMLPMVRGDAADFREIAKLLREFKIEKAREKAHSLDTAARDSIPECVWDAMESHCGRDDDIDEEVEVTQADVDQLIAERDLLNLLIDEARKKLGEVRWVI